MTRETHASLTGIVADDEYLARHRIRKLLERHPTVQVLAECATGPAAVQAIRQLSPDILFLDVQMPGINGFDVLAALRPDERPIVIFSTAYDEYALAAFEVHAVDYLLKPYSDDRFDEAVRRATEVLSTQRLHDWHDRVHKLLNEVAPGPPNDGSHVPNRITMRDRFAVPSGDRLVMVEATAIDWIEAAKDYVRLHAGNRTFVLRSTMTAVGQQLDPNLFLRIHRSTIVQVARIRELCPDSHGDYVAILQDGTQLRVSRRYRDTVLARLGAR